MKKLVVIIIALLLLSPTTAYSATGQVESGLTPDSWFYWFDRLAERIQLVFTFDAQAKSEALSKIGLERLAEAQEVESESTVDQLISEYQENQEEATEQAGEDADTLVGLVENQAEALERLSVLIDEIGGSAERRAVKTMTAIARLLVKQSAKLDKISENAPNAAVRTTKIIAKTTDRLTKLGDKLSRISLDSSATPESSATPDGKSIEELVEHIKEVTSKHLAVLKKVLEKVPDSAKPTIEKAIERSSHGGETAVKSVLKRGSRVDSDTVEGNGDDAELSDDDEAVQTQSSNRIKKMKGKDKIREKGSKKP